MVIVRMWIPFFISHLVSFNQLTVGISW
jgi:hypothetical protein